MLDHRVYKSYDPRARITKQIAEEVFQVAGRNAKLDIALELERIAPSDEYFIERKLYPNVDCYSGIVYQAMGFTPDMFTVDVCHSTHGRLAQWQEMLQDPKQRIARPRRHATHPQETRFNPKETRQSSLQPNRAQSVVHSIIQLGAFQAPVRSA